MNSGEEMVHWRAEAERLELRLIAERRRGENRAAMVTEVLMVAARTRAAEDFEVDWSGTTYTDLISDREVRRLKGSAGSFCGVGVVVRKARVVAREPRKVVRLHLRPTKKMARMVVDSAVTPERKDGPG